MEQKVDSFDVNNAQYRAKIDFLSYIMHNIEQTIESFVVNNAQYRAQYRAKNESHIILQPLFLHSSSA